MRPVVPASLSLSSIIRLSRACSPRRLNHCCSPFLLCLEEVPWGRDVRYGDRDVDKLDSDRREDEEGDGDVERWGDEEQAGEIVSRNNYWENLNSRPLHDDLVGELRGFPGKAWGRPSPPETSHPGHSNCWGLQRKLVAKLYFVEIETSPEFRHIELLRLLKKMENGTSVEPPPSFIDLSNWGGQILGKKQCITFNFPFTSNA